MIPGAPRVTSFLVEVGDPHVDEAWCVCGAKQRASTRRALMIWSYLHVADHLKFDHQAEGV